PARAPRPPQPTPPPQPGRTPADRLSAAAQRRLAAFLARLLRHPEPAVRLQVLGRCIELPLADPETLLLPAVLESLRARASVERQAAARAAFSLAADADAERIAGSIREGVEDRRALRDVMEDLAQQP